MRGNYEILNSAVAGIYQRQRPLKCFLFVITQSLLFAHKTFEVCNILGGFVLRATYCVVHYVEHCNNIFVIPMVCIYSVVCLIVCCVVGYPLSCFGFLSVHCRKFSHDISIVILYVPFSSPPAL